MGTECLLQTLCPKQVLLLVFRFGHPVRVQKKRVIRSRAECGSP